MEGVSVSFYVATTEATWEGFVPASSSVNISHAGESRQRELEAAGHVEPIVREQRKVNASLLSSSPSPFLQFREWCYP